MKKGLAVLMAVILLALVTITCAAEAQHQFTSFTTADGANYDLFEITKLNYDKDHKVTSVTGHFTRVVQGEEYEEPEEAPDSEKTYPLAADFSAEMYEGGNDTELKNIPVTDLYEWYIDSYIGRENYDGNDLVFSCDLTPEERDTTSADFWFVTTKIELNDQEEIRFMEWIYVPWF